MTISTMIASVESTFADFVLYTTERPSHVAKNRLGLPDELPLDWHAYASFFHQPHSKNGEPTHG